MKGRTKAYNGNRFASSARDSGALIGGSGGSRVEGISAVIGGIISSVEPNIPPIPTQRIKVRI